MKITPKQKTRIENACKALGFHPYQWESSYLKSDAQQNLAGRTHYADDSTLRYFKARITGLVRTPADGLLYCIIESVASKPEQPSKRTRGVVFDVFGTVIHRTEWVRTTDQGRKALGEYIAAFDLVAHYRKEISERIARMRYDATRAAKLLAGKAVA